MAQTYLVDALEGLPVRIVDAFNLWPALCIARSIPLGRLDWSWTNRGNTVKEFSLAAKAVFHLLEQPELTELPIPAQAYEWFSRAYVHILLVPLDELVSQRDSPAWQYVRKFVEASREKRFEYIVAVVADGSAVRQHRKLLERLRGDVNLQRRDRVVTVPGRPQSADMKPISHLYNSAPHQELLIRLRECIRDAAEFRIAQYETELERLIPMRASPNWSFCYFFAVKESMAFVFCQLGRRDMALKLFDELHAFMVEYDEKEGTRQFCSEPPCVAAANATNVRGKDYRKLLVDNAITEMEMRTYLFARQTEIMLPDRKFSDIAERGLKLIIAISRRCIEEAAKDTSKTFSCFRDAWVFTAARNLTATLAPAIPSPVPGNNAVVTALETPKERHTARLIAGFHVHAQKSFQGLARVLLPGVMTAANEGEDPITSAQKQEILQTFNAELRDALSAKARAETLYSEIANAAALLYEMGGRPRGAAALDGDAGVVRLRNGSLDEAERLLSAQCSRFADDYSWDDLHLRKRKELARAEKKLDKVQEYLVSCLTMLFMTRSVRKIHSSTLQPASRRQQEKERAVKWEREAYETAAKLPRVMKYKAEKLVTISVKGNLKRWIEGDAAKAVVIIHSDIATELRIDSLFMELKSWTGSSTDKKSPSEAQEKPETPSIASGTVPANAVARGKTMTLKSKDKKMRVQPGNNEFSVYSSEVAWHGRYSVNLIALFIGNLKLVQVAPKPDSFPMVGIKGATSSKEALAKVANASQQPDIGKAQVRFPNFFAQPRAVPASVHVVQNTPLYLVQGPVQYVRVNVKSEIHGIAKGAKIFVELSFADDQMQTGKGVVEDSKTTVVEVMDGNETKGGEDVENPLSDFPVPFQCKSDDSGTLEVTVNRDVDEGSTICVRLSVALPANVCLATIETSDQMCFVKARVSGRERSSSAKREFSCATECCLSLVSPLAFRSRADLSGRSLDAHSPHVLDESLLKDGGTFYCSVQSNVVEDRAVTLKKASLHLPHWLQLQNEDQNAHDDVLPSKLYENSRFIFAFDVFICGINSPPRKLNSSLSKMTSLSHRRHARRSKDFSELVDLDDSSEQESGKNSDVLLSGGDGTDNKIDVSQSTDLEMAVRKESKHVENMEGTGEDVEMTKTFEAMDISDHGSLGVGHDSPKSPDVPEIGDVVDLSGGVNGTSDKIKNSPLPVLNTEDSYATMHIEFDIEGLNGGAHVERAFSMNSFQPQRYMYRIQRVCPKRISAGETVELMFSISMEKNLRLVDNESQETQELMYDVEADVDTWIIAGRQRGRFTLSGGSCEQLSIIALPLTCGRIQVPTVNLYSSSGRQLPETCFDNLNKCKQVLVLPSSHVTSVCTQTKGDAADSLLRLASIASGAHDVKVKEQVPKVYMPEVVTFENFFES